jgi:hypothetical protein
MYSEKYEEKCFPQICHACKCVEASVGLAGYPLIRSERELLIK